MKVKLKIAVGFIMALGLLLVGCTKEEDLTENITSKEIENMEERISQLTKKLNESENQISELQDLFEQNSNSNSDAYNELNSKTYMLENLVSKLPNIQTKQGYINSITIDGTNIVMEVKFATKLEDKDAPNGFVIEEKDTSNVKVDNSASFFVLEGTKINNIVSIEEFKAIVGEYNRLFNLYIVNNQVVMVEEQYLP